MTEQKNISIKTLTVGDSEEPLVFLHGLFGQGRNFNQIAKGLQPEIRSVLVDLPNHGRSDWTEEFSYRQFAQIIADAITEDFDVDTPVNVLGHSMGGKVAMALALENPEIVKRLIVADISPVEGESIETFEHYLGSLKKLPLQSMTRRSEAEEELAYHVEDPMIRGFLLQTLTQKESGGFAFRNNLDMLFDELDAMSGFEEFGDRQFDKPVLWIAGENSDYIRDEHAEPMRSLFPRTHQVTIKNAGHWVHADQPEVFVSVVRRFLTAQSATA